MKNSKNIFKFALTLSILATALCIYKIFNESTAGQVSSSTISIFIFNILATLINFFNVIEK